MNWAPLTSQSAATADGHGVGVRGEEGPRHRDGAATGHGVGPGLLGPGGQPGEGPLGRRGPGEGPAAGELDDPVVELHHRVVGGEGTLDVEVAAAHVEPRRVGCSSRCTSSRPRGAGRWWAAGVEGLLLFSVTAPSPVEVMPPRVTTLPPREGDRRAAADLQVGAVDEPVAGRAAPQAPATLQLSEGTPGLGIGAEPRGSAGGAHQRPEQVDVGRHLRGGRAVRDLDARDSPVVPTS